MPASLRERSRTGRSRIPRWLMRRNPRRKLKNPQSKPMPRCALLSPARLKRPTLLIRRRRLINRLRKVIWRLNLHLPLESRRQANLVRHRKLPIVRSQKGLLHVHRPGHQTVWAGMMQGYQPNLIYSTIGIDIAWVAVGDTTTTTRASQSTELGSQPALTGHQQDHLQMNNNFAVLLIVRDVFRRSNRGLIDPVARVHLKVLAMNRNVRLEKDQSARGPIPRLILIV